MIDGARDRADAGLSAHVAESVDMVAALRREHDRSATRLQRVIDRVTDHLGRPAALIVMVAVLAIWAGLALLTAGGGVDRPMFAWLEATGTLAALVISMLILATQRREDELAERRAQLTLELALLADRRSAKIIALLEELRRDQPNVDDRIDAESDAMATPTDPRTVAAAIEARVKEAE